MEEAIRELPDQVYIGDRIDADLEPDKTIDIELPKSDNDCINLILGISKFIVDHNDVYSVQSAPRLELPWLHNIIELIYYYFMVKDGILAKNQPIKICTYPWNCTEKVRYDWKLVKQHIRQFGFNIGPITKNATKV